MSLVDASLLGDGLDRALIIAAKHHDFLNSCGLQIVDSVGCVGTHRVADRDDTEHLTPRIGARLVAYDDNRLTLSFHALEGFLNFLRGNPPFVRKSVVPDKVMMPLNLGLCTPARPSLIVFASREIH